MKIKFDADLDWVSDNGDIDEEVKSGLINAVFHKVENRLTEEIEKILPKKINEKLDYIVNKTYDNFLDNIVTITDE